jgi:hypothetical protein
MKKIVTLIAILTSMNSFASYHFQCYKKIGFNQFDASMQMLMPNLADLTSGASFNGPEDQSPSENFTFSFIGKKWIQMQGVNGEVLKIQSQGNQRLMRITRNDKDTEVFKCFIESSI